MQRLGWRLPLWWWPRKWPMQSKQFRRRQKLNNQRGVQRSSSDIIKYHRSTGKSWSNTSPNNNGECAAEVAVVAKRIATHCDSTGLHQLSLWSARRCTLPLHRQPAHILRTIGRTRMRAAEGAAPTTTAATATTWPGTPAAT